MAQTTSALSKQPTLWGHPKGLFVLFFTEMWERFSYYGMRALLMLYMAKYLLLDPEKASSVLGYDTLKAVLEAFLGPLQVSAMSAQIYGIYTGLVYFTPLFGGILADRMLGQRKSVYLGGFLMAIGHFLMAAESLFLPALFFLILGNGCFKPNISSQVGNLYEQGDARRDSAFTIFYMGINLGAFFSPLVCGTLGQKVGWHYGFGAAGIGMLLGLVVYHFGRHLLPQDRITQRAAQAIKEGHTQNSEPLTKQEMQRILALAVLCMLNIAFWGIFEQQGSSLQLWAEDNTNWHFLGFDLPSSWYQSMNPAFIFMFAPFLDMWWRHRAKQGHSSSSTSKMGLGCLLTGAAFIIMIVASKMVAADEKGSLLWLAGTTWLFTMGELYVSPIGLSLVTKLAPARLVSMLMGMWLMSSFFGNYLAGYIASWYDVMPKDNFFTLLTGMGIAAGLLFYGANIPLKKIIGKGV